MANVAHSTLTGSSLHEPKGIAAQTSGKVYVSDGAGSGAWTATSTFPGSFGSAIFWVREQQAQNVASTYSGAASTWNDLILNTSMFNNISGASLASNHTSLPAGTYIVLAFVEATGTSFSAKLRFRDVTHGTTLVVGPQSVQDNSSGPNTASLRVMGTFSLGSTSGCALQIWSNAANTKPFGTTLSAGEVEAYSEVYVWKVG
jgi:hypothetical protein